jgi:hypothetical protein
MFAFDLATRNWLPPDTNALPTISGWVPTPCPAFPSSLYDDQYVSCWKGEVNGVTYRLMGGRNSGLAYYTTKQIAGGCCLGKLSVAVFDAKDTGGWSIGQANDYATQDEIGALYITAIRGTLIELAPYDPRFKNMRLTFDLSTRQWVPPVPTTP